MFTSASGAGAGPPWESGPPAWLYEQLPYSDPQSDCHAALFGPRHL
ncbi:hypothetical protein EV192_12816 [Actinocrispum wychmicini]|uniref:Uncharacterized protein n=1 Tax=Actinocrispum wychmicini TaxID=1213861 RepID=A0A4R2IGA7_9PSEU|nr:hypothetical protein EV192_12816 [Actinocrispum wychmicini]